jgi:hypothetical protein
VALLVKRDSPYSGLDLERFPMTVSSLAPRPSAALIQGAMRKWETIERFTDQEKAIRFLFQKHCPRNDDVAQVLLKVTALNAFYHTSIFDLHSVAKHIVAMRVDGRIAAGDVSLVNEMALITVGGKLRKLYSFASKYCCQHNPECFPIYDSVVDKLLSHYQRIDGFSTFSRNELKDYRRFAEVVGQFRTFYGLQSCSLRDIDRFLWLAGKGELRPSGSLAANPPAESILNAA